MAARKLPNKLHVGTFELYDISSYNTISKPAEYKITFEQVKAITNASDSVINRYLDHLNACADKFSINTPLRKAHFLAQLAHESGCFKYTEEVASGVAYNNRKDLGNGPDDGPRFKGRGLIQITGKKNYTALGTYLGRDLITNDNWLLLKDDPELTVMSAGWFWDVYTNLNPYADQDSLLWITRLINGGFNGLVDRWKKLKKAYFAFGIEDKIEPAKEAAKKTIQDAFSKISARVPDRDFLTHDQEKSISALKRDTHKEEYKPLDKFINLVKNASTSALERSIFLTFRTQSEVDEIKNKFI